MATGAQATLTFTVSGWSATLVSIGSLRRFRAVVEQTGLGDAAEKSCPGSVVRSDPMEVSYYHNQDEPPPIAAAAEAAVLNFPPNEGQTVGPKIMADLFVTEASTPELTNEAEMLGTMSVKWTGTIQEVDGS